ncbi:S1 RNA-binding domain-containing protein, partial [Candidatus Omnitrophota bacterium]
MSEDTKKQTNTEEKFDLEAAYAKTFRKLSEGDIVIGKVIAIGKKDVYIDFGYKSEGLITLPEFKELKDVKVGDEFEVLVESKENEDGMILVSKKKAEKTQGWNKILNKCKEGDFVDGRVARKVKGGLMVDIGIEAFLPASLVALKGFGNVNQIMGQTLNFKIVKMNKL